MARCKVAEGWQHPIQIRTVLHRRADVLRKSVQVSMGRIGLGRLCHIFKGVPFHLARVPPTQKRGLTTPKYLKSVASSASISPLVQTCLVAPRQRQSYKAGTDFHRFSRTHQRDCDRSPDYFTGTRC